MNCHQRKENIFLIGLWFGTGKPIMTTFLKPFTDELARLGNIGMTWVRGSVSIHSRVFACICSCDSVARCLLQNIFQFNGLYGCSWCENPGETIEKGRGHCRVYLEEVPQPDLRTGKQIAKNGRLAFCKKKPVKGVKGPTILSKLPYFDIARGFVVDNLHCVDLGITRQLGHLWFDSTNHSEPWYLGKHIEAVDARLKSVMPPHEITRVPRSVTQRAFWKVSEWHWWLLLYSPVVLHGLLPPQYFKHLPLLVEGVYLLTKSSISPADLNKASHCVLKFAKNFQVLYGKMHMSYNVHQLTHLVQAVIDWGPLPCYSSYIFEGFNMVLLNLFHGTQAVPHQIVNSFLMCRKMSMICSTGKEIENFPNEDILFSFINAQLQGHAPRKKARKVEGNITFLGASYSRPLSIEERYLVEEFLERNDIENDGEFFMKAIVKENVFHCTNYKRQSRRKNYVVGTKKNLVFELVVFALIRFQQCHDICSIAFGREVKLSDALVNYESGCGNLCSHIKKLEWTCDELKIVELGNIQDKFAAIDNVSDQYFYCKLPNIVDRD